MLQLKLLALTLVWWWTWYHHHHGAVVADPQTFLINKGCSTYIYNGTNLRDFLANVNGLIPELRAEISNSSKHFGTAQETRGEITTSALFQCRNYLSKRDCLACFNTAATQNRNCSGSGARSTYDGCFLR